MTWARDGLRCRTTATLLYTSPTDRSYLCTSPQWTITPRQYTDWPCHHCPVLLPIFITAGFVAGEGWDRRRLRCCDNANGENTTRPARARSRTAQRFAGAGPTYPITWLEPVPAESATGPMEKMPHRGDVQVQHHTAERRARSCSTRHPLSDFELS